MCDSTREQVCGQQGWGWSRSGCSSRWAQGCQGSRGDSRVLTVHGDGGALGSCQGPRRAAVGFWPCVLAGILQLGRQPLLLFCLSPPAPLPAASLTGLAALELCAHSFSPHLPHCLKTLRPLPDGWAAPSHPDQGLARALPQEPWPGLGTAPLPHVSLQTISFGYVTEGSSSPA